VRVPSTLAIVCSAVALLAGAAACGAGSPPRTAPAPQASAAATALEQSFVGVINRAAPDVVQISTGQALGSGVVFDRAGDVVTNAHVVAGGGTLRVTDASGRAYSANLVGTFVPDDLAVVHAEGASLPAASFGDSRKLRVGDIVLAIGNPLGLRSSVTEGIVSALGRTVAEPSGIALPNVIQTSAPINPGNSGGALVDLSGRVVGIPTLAATDPELGGSAAPGIGFAIPSAVVTDIAGQIVKNGHVVASHRAFLGVSLASGLSKGAVVASVTRGGPAARAGIKPGSVITSIDGQAVGSPSDVSAILATLTPGQTVSVTIVKPNGASATFKVTLGQYPGSGS
jgi:putative serine protease PepD